MFTQPLRRHTAGAAALAVGLVLTACATAPPPSSQPTRPPDPGHIHGLAIDDSGKGWVASHTGLYELDAADDQAAAIAGPVGDSRFDMMGFTVVDDTFYASGHPGENPSGDLTAPNLGLVSSRDRGQTWQTVSLTGEADFHALTAIPGDADDATELYGVDSGTGQVTASRDGGRSWVRGAELTVSSLAGDPSRPGTLYATTSVGLAISTNRGARFTIDPDAPILVYLIARPDGSFLGLGADQSLWTKPKGGVWTPTRPLPAPARNLAVSPNGQTLLIADTNDDLQLSHDGGKTWTKVTRS